MPPSPWRTLGWACYLACSWTWCIGMWLPVILIRDFGWWSFPAFAVPNCLGAAAMGWVLSRPEASESTHRAHRPLVMLFSIVTLAFQLFFFAWLLQGFLPLNFRTWPVWLFVVVFLVSLAMNDRPKSLLPWSAAVFLASLAILVVFLRHPTTPHSLTLPTPPSFPHHLAFLAPTFLFGFALCPYLDATFHRARTAAPARAGDIAFGVGFLALFLSMIVGTLLYAGTALAAGSPGAPGSLPRFLVIHVLLQLAFTGAIHLVVIPNEARTLLLTSRARTVVTVLLILGAALVLLAGTPLLRFRSSPALSSLLATANLSGEEVIYRLFMSFYGLVFPAYVWLCMLGRWTTPPTRRHITMWLVACAVAAPMFWMGFIERVHWWLAPGLVVVLVAKLFVPRRGEPDAGAGVATTRNPTNPPLAASAASD